MCGMFFKIFNMSLPSSKNRYYKTTAKILMRKIVIKFQFNLRLKCVELCAYQITRDQSRPRLPKKYLAINKHGKIIFLPNSKHMHSGNNLSSLQNQTFKDLGVLGHFANKP